MKKKLIAGAAGAVLVSAVGLGVALPAQAETATADSSATTASNSANDRHPSRGHGGRGPDAATLSAELGVTETAVSDALSAVRESLEPDTRPSLDATEAERVAAREDRQSAFAAALAAELDMDEATVTTALSEIRATLEAARANEKPSNDNERPHGDEAHEGHEGHEAD